MKMETFFSIRGYSPYLLVLFFSLLCAGCSEDFQGLEISDEAAPNIQPTLKNTIAPNNYITGQHKDGGIWEIALPENWNELKEKNVLVFAHGYVVPNAPLELPNDKIDGILVKQIVNNMGWAYAATSYRSNGLAVKDAINDIIDLRLIVDTLLTESHGYHPPNYVFLGGVSEGGIIGTLTIEQNPELFDAAIVTCCPIGDFYKHLQYVGDFHVLFNYFFKDDLLALGVDMGSPEGVPQSTMALWINGTLQQIIIGVLLQNPEKVVQLLNTAKVPVDRNDQTAVGSAILDLLKFNVMATNEAILRLGGNPFNNNNPKKWYFGSDNDLKLNRKVERIQTDSWENARAEVENFYQTTGNLSLPLVYMHTTGDHVAPFWHQPLYVRKVFLNKDGRLHVPIPIKRFGHCTFTLQEVETAIQLMQFKLLQLNRLNIPHELQAKSTP
ncbi:MAG: alpha/beta hydrolase family protein [Marinifilaceae bacterium]